MDIQLYEAIQHYLINHKLPNHTPSDVKQLALRKIHEFTLKNNQLYWRKEGIERRVVQRHELEEILFNLHGSQLGGHFNTEATFNKAKRNYYWPRMYKEVESYVRSCDTCQRLGNKKKIEQLHPIEVGKVFDRVGIDIVGPLPITSSENRYIIVATEYLTKWPEAKAIKDIQANTVAQFIYEEIICRHGAPKVLLSDRGTSFVNSVVKSLCDTMKTAHVLTTAYHPQTNGLTERFNKTLCETLAKYVIQNDNLEWDQFIPSALFAYRTKIQKSTKFSPFFLLYGRNEETPLTRKSNPEENDFEWDLEEHIKLITERLHHVHMTAKQNINKAQTDQKDRYDKKIKLVQFKIEQVLLWESHHENVHGDKFREKWSGPFLIHQVWKNGVYKLRETETTRILRTPINGNRLKKYFDRLAWEPTIWIN